MIRTEALKPGLVFNDPSKITIPEERRYYRIMRDAPEKNGRWLAEHIASSDICSIGEEDLERIKAVSADPFCEVDLGCLLGHKWAIEVAHGTITGVIREVRSRGFKISQPTEEGGTEETIIRMPFAYLVDGDEINVSEVRSMTLAE